MPSAGRWDDRAMATEIEPGPVVNGMVSGKKAMSSGAPGPARSGSVLRSSCSCGVHQQAPGPDGHHQAAGHPQGAQADAEEVQDIAAQQQRAEQDQKA
jgi:hypothetical protein